MPEHHEQTEGFIPADNFGLDAIRALAISLVLLCHGIPFYRALLDHAHIDREFWSTLTGFSGVEIFFCLSGFLIGNILVNIEKGGITTRSATRFFARRWLRTLPLYYTAILFLLLWRFFDPGPRDHLLSFCTLTQNLFGPMPTGNWFGISWSLTIEEWSYLILPALAFGVFRRSSRPVFYGLTSLIATALCIRIAMSNNIENWDVEIRKVVVMRLDAICYGAAIVTFYRSDPRRFFKFSKYAAPLVLAALAGSLWLCYHTAYLKTLYGRIFVLPVTSLALSSLLPWALKLRVGDSLITRTVRYLSRISYSIYLFHIPMYFLTAIFLGNHKGWQFFTFILGTMLTASLFSITIEQPIMRMRPKQF